MITIIVDAIIIKDKKILLVQRSEKEDECGKWSFPGGVANRGELKKDALLRELREELKIEAKNIRFFQEYSMKSNGNTIKAFYYLCDFSEKSLKLNNELSNYGWFPIDERILDFNFAFNQKLVAQDLLNSQFLY
ncbi:MAG: NUDIX hydrolase [Candidatus Moranbacteria bacterium]|nr:NUDIX hydrolase [Candidatus Moranbacteria bacterium]